MICYPGEQQLLQKSSCWSAGIERQTYLTPTASPLLQCYDTGDYTHLRLADTEVGTSQANVLFHSSHSHLLSVSPLSLSCIAIYLLLSLNASLSLLLSITLSPGLSVFLSHLLLRLKNIKWNIWATVVILARVEKVLVCTFKNVKTNTTKRQKLVFTNIQLLYASSRNLYMHLCSREPPEFSGQVYQNSLWLTL